MATAISRDGKRKITAFQFPGAVVNSYSYLGIQCYPRFKNLSFGCKSLELCADVAPDVDIKAKSGV